MSGVGSVVLRGLNSNAKRLLFNCSPASTNFASFRNVNTVTPIDPEDKIRMPLDGVKVLDMSRVVAGPFCTMLLGDLGADIIKVENPGVGDDSRRWGPPFVERNGEKVSCYFLAVNRNKRSVGINFKNPQGVELIKELAKKADVLVENFVPGKLASYGLGYEDLKQISPKLIYCSISGFGQEGPYSHRAGYDEIAASIGGLLHITGPENGPPCAVGVATTDLSTGLYAHGAIMAALLYRLRTGEGQWINCDLLSTQVSTLGNAASNYLNGGVDTERLGTAHASIVPYQAFPSKDAFFTIGCGNDQQFRDFCNIINRPDLTKEPHFANNEQRAKHRRQLATEISAVMRTKTNKEWNDLFMGEPNRKVHFAFGPVNNMEEVFKDPQVVYNKMQLEMEHETVGTVQQVGPAVKFSTIINGPRFAPPPLCYHTDEVLTEILEFSDEKIAQLRSTGIVV